MPKVFNPKTQEMETGGQLEQPEEAAPMTPPTPVEEAPEEAPVEAESSI